MTDEELKALYISRIDPVGSGWEGDDSAWWRDCVAAVRRCVEAKDINAAVRSLERDEWCNPVDCAMKLRGETTAPTLATCPKCGHSFVLEKL